MEALAIIPARGGSKRIPRKNIRALLSKPLILYTIEAALASACFSRVVVSTDDAEIAKVAKDGGAEVPFLRQAALADDHSPVSLVSVDMVNRLAEAGHSFEFVCQLMPNCPLRGAADIQDSLKQFRASGAGTQLSVTRYGWLNPWWAFKENEGRLEPLFPEALKQRSQDLPELVCPTGAIWWAQTEVLLRENTFHTSERRGFELPWQRAVDIDDEGDWLLAETLLRMQQAGAAL